MYPTLTPYLGRDYRSKAAVVAALRAGMDFVLNQYGSRWDGMPCNLSDLRSSGVSLANVRYGQLRRVAVVDLRKLAKTE